MNAEFLQLPAQGVSDLQSSYDHALAGLVKAGAELNRVGTEMDRAEISFRHAINEYFNQLQFQIDHKDKAIRLIMEQKVETFDAMYSMQNQLAKLRDEKTVFNTKTENLTGIMNGNPRGTGNVLPRGMLQESLSGNSCTDIFRPQPVS